MRTGVLFAFALLTVVVGNVCGAAPPKTAAKPADDNAAAIDQLAKTIFAAADSNHNRVLNKREFEEADEALDEQVQQWGKTGVIGKPKKPNPRSKDAEKDRVVPTVSAAEATGNKLARSNRVSEAEFTFYVRSVVDEADEYWRQVNATADAQRKAYNAARQAMPRRGRARMPVPYIPY